MILVIKYVHSTNDGNQNKMQILSVCCKDDQDWIIFNVDEAMSSLQGQSIWEKEDSIPSSDPKFELHSKVQWKTQNHVLDSASSEIPFIYM